MLDSNHVTAPAATPADPGLTPFPQHAIDQYRRLGLWGGRSLPSELFAAARVHGDRIALVTPEVRWTYRELFGRAADFGAGLLAVTTLRAGDAVLFQMGNVAETVVAYLGCLAAGVRPVCTLPQHGEREVSLLATHVGARGLLIQADFGKGEPLTNAQSLLERELIGVVIVARGEPMAGAVSFQTILSGGSMLPAPDDVNPDEIVVFQLSGGTTGLPKVAPRLHEEYVYNSRAWAEALRWSPATKVLYPLPLLHNAGIALALQPALLSGASIVLAPSARIDVLLDLIEAERPTTLPLVPPALAIRLLEEPRSRTVDLSCIEDYIVGGQRLPVEIAERLRDELGISVRQMFGMAEGMFLVTPADASEELRFHTVGQPISSADEVRILEIDGTAEVPFGEIGEFCVRGPYTIRGYYRAAEHNADTFTDDGFYRTGDLARAHHLDGTTVYSIEGRIKDVINRGVEKIHAEEVEELILRHPDVTNAALVAMPDEVLGERACVYLILEENAPHLAVSTLGEFLLGQGLAKYKLPERVEIVDQFPLSNVGKVSKKTLRETITNVLLAEREHHDSPATGAR
ncbi:2,3-dihydroxybenzoate-AMP ligase [Rhodococcus opacus]|nr:AMP-binding protein [Rhodococcus opacus]MDH6292462.1 2,3-dihydroxybenzoate-AMP ligase [Rhodococcus opacus]